jgi:hypothetical protein
MGPVRGRVTRVEDDRIAYIAREDDGETFSFIPGVISNYRGEEFAELGVRLDTPVEFEWNKDSGVVTRVVMPALPATRSTYRDSSEEVDPDYAARANPARPTADVQLELDPDAAPRGKAVALRALPRETRTFGKLLDTRDLEPGDLMLTRDGYPGGISSTITQVQVEGGYAPQDARWTHAALYLGDGESVVEATFDSLHEGGSVRLTRLDEYCKGDQFLRFRRSNQLRNGDNWRICVRAMSRIGKKYDFLYAARLWFNVALRKKGFYDDNLKWPTARAVICSTLYADSYNEATRYHLGELCGVCVPAWLSLCSEFSDIEVGWLQIR